MSESLTSLAGAANSAIADEVPSIDKSPDTSVKLLRGLLNPETLTWETTAEVKEITGEDEEVLASLDSKEDLSYSDYLNELLKRAVISIGSLSIAKNPHLIDDLLIGDRDLLFLGVVRAAYGRAREMQLTCGTCQKDNDVTIDLIDDFKVETNNVDLTQPISVVLKNGEEVLFSYPTSGDGRYASKKGKTVAEQNTLIIARCLIDSMDRDSRESWAKKLNIADRKKITKAITSVQPGPRMGEVETQCAHCDTNLTVVIDWVSLLFG
jgi:hypothetical protein